MLLAQKYRIWISIEPLCPNRYAHVHLSCICLGKRDRHSLPSHYHVILVVMVIITKRTLTPYWRRRTIRMEAQMKEEEVQPLQKQLKRLESTSISSTRLSNSPLGFLIWVMLLHQDFIITFVQLYYSSKLCLCNLEVTFDWAHAIDMLIYEFASSTTPPLTSWM